MMTVRMLAERLVALDQSAIVYVSDDVEGRDAVLLRGIDNVHTDIVILKGWNE